MFEAVLFGLWSIFLIEAAYFYGRKDGYKEAALNAIKRYIETRKRLGWDESTGK